MTTTYRLVTIEPKGRWIMRNDNPLVHLRSEVTDEQAEAILAALEACELPTPEPEDPRQLHLFPS